METTKSLWQRLRSRLPILQKQPDPEPEPAPEPVPPPPPPQIALALGGGGGKGSAHIGVLECLNHIELPIDMLVGTSAGGAVALLYAAGFSYDEIEQIFRDVSLRRIAAADPTRTGLIGQHKREQYLAEQLGERSFADLALPCAVVTVDLITGEVVVIDEGPLLPAILATTAIPGLLPPIRYGERLLIDGGVRNNLPVDIAMQRCPGGKVIAVDLSTGNREFEISTELPENPLARLTLAPRQFSIAQRSLDLLIATTTELRLAQHPPEILLRPAVDAIETFDLTTPELGRQAGFAAAEEQRMALESLRDWRLPVPDPEPEPAAEPEPPARSQPAWTWPWVQER
jgi:NTE family protein